MCVEQQNNNTFVEVIVPSKSVFTCASLLLYKLFHHSSALWVEARTDTTWTPDCNLSSQHWWGMWYPEQRWCLGPLCAWQGLSPQHPADGGFPQNNSPAHETMSLSTWEINESGQCINISTNWAESHLEREKWVTTVILGEIIEISQNCTSALLFRQIHAAFRNVRNVCMYMSSSFSQMNHCFLEMHIWHKTSISDFKIISRVASGNFYFATGSALCFVLFDCSKDVFLLDVNLPSFNHNSWHICLSEHNILWSLSWHLNHLLTFHFGELLDRALWDARMT